jgi:hypothetical protein
VDKGRSIQSTTQREQMYVSAIGAFYRDFETVDHKSRALAYEKQCSNCISATQRMAKLVPSMR